MLGCVTSRTNIWVNLVFWSGWDKNTIALPRSEKLCNKAIHYIRNANMYLLRWFFCSMDVFLSSMLANMNAKVYRNVAHIRGKKWTISAGWKAIILIRHTYKIRMWFWISGTLGYWSLCPWPGFVVSFPHLKLNLFSIFKNKPMQRTWRKSGFQYLVLKNKWSN